MVYLVKLNHFTGLDAAATDSNDILAEISVLTNKVIFLFNALNEKQRKRQKS